jgi:uncharacterized repeat protein (TIGR01451 family)
LAAKAQVFIPDPNMRDLLNQQIPGIVDGAGIMDTLHPAIAELDTVYYYSPIVSGEFDLEGIQFLDSLSLLHLGFALLDVVAIHCNALPTALRDLSFSQSGGSLSLPELPQALDNLSIHDDLPYENQTDVSIVSLPDSLVSMDLSSIHSLDCGQAGFVQTIRLFHDLGEQMTLSLPPITADHVILNRGRTAFLDLSAIDASSILLFHVTIEGAVYWPSNMQTLTIHDAFAPNGIGDLPGSLRSLYLTLTFFDCLPTLPDSLEVIQLGEPFACLPNLPVTLTECSGCPSDWNGNIRVCSVLNSDCPGSYPGIAGHVFADLDADGTYDAGEPGLPQIQVLLQPNNHSTGVDGSGYYELGVPPGQYSIATSTTYPYIQGITPSTHNADVPNLGDSDIGNDFAVTLTPDIQDLRVSLFADPARPGFDNRLYLSCQNYGTTEVNATLILNFDADQSWVGSSIAPSSNSGNSATWNMPGMAIGSTANITVDLNTAASVVLGTGIQHTLTADPIATDETPADNTTLYNDSVVGSYDPNDKLLSPEALTPEEVQNGSTAIEYTIRFQNTGTYMAERVVILDTLSTDLLPESFRFIASSHACQWYLVDGVLHFIHNGIDLPDSTSDEANSHGFVKFSLLPRADLMDGASITNIAHIVFDFNEAIITPPAVFNVDAATGLAERAVPTLHLAPNPATDLLRVSATDGSVRARNYAIIDALGQVVIRGRSDANGWIPVNNCAPGPYLLELQEPREAHRFVKQ